MAISMLTALEIFTNPADLEIDIWIEKSIGKFCIGIFRGPGHSFKSILTSQPFTEKEEDAVETVKVLLEEILTACTKEFKNPVSITCQYLNPDMEEIDQSKVLTHDLIEQILNELRRNRLARTYEMLNPRE